jgi:glycosyltransferase involved in cell wall biosynthesis
LVGDAGLLAPPANPKALAEAMVSVMRLPSEDRKALGRAARSRIRSEFSMNAKADEWESLYRTLLQSN